jgi:biopolymer transport protein ExbB
MNKFMIAGLSLILVMAIAGTTAVALAAEGSQTSIETGQDPQPALPSFGEKTATTRTLFDVIRSGGPLMIPIGLCSIILLVFVFERLASLRRSRIVPKPFVKRMLEELRERAIERDEALERCEQESSHVATVFAAGIRKWGKPSVEVEQAVLDAGERVANELRKYLRVINGIATVCPLFGLLGTVLGMIQAFDAIAAVDSSIADPKALTASGISVALITTAAGLTVALPSIIAWLYFTGRVDQRVMEIDSLGQQLVAEISAEALEQQRGSGRTRKSARKPAA